MLRLPTLLVALILLGGCGGEDRLTHGQYQDTLLAEWVPIGSQLLKQRVAISRAPTGRIASDRLTTLQEALRRGADTFGRLAPPADASAANGELERALRSLADGLEQARRKTRSDDLRPLASFESDFARLPGVTELRSALENLQAAGYVLQG